MTESEAKTPITHMLPLGLMAIGGITLLRASPLLTIALAGIAAYEFACSADRGRRASRDFEKEAEKEAKLDTEIEDSFPASDPPSFSGGIASGR